MRAVLCVLFVWGLLWDSVRAGNSISTLRAAAVELVEELQCRKWDCECVFERQRGCCCASKELQEAEDDMFLRLMDLSRRLTQLTDSVIRETEGTHVAFTASMSPRTECFGPFTINMPIPYDVIMLNQGSGYNPALGLFTAPRSGLYSFSFSVYSKVALTWERMYYKVQLMRNGEVVASIWEDNREDTEDSSSQSVLLSLEQGGQVYMELLRGRQLCGNVMGLNTFTGALLYPSHPAA